MGSGRMTPDEREEGRHAGWAEQPEEEPQVPEADESPAAVELSPNEESK